MARLLIDTNVLVYAIDPRDRAKQARAAEILDDLVSFGDAAVSAQSLAEFFRVTTERLRPPLTAADARDRVDELARTFAVVAVTDAVVIEACQGVVDHRLAFWDALIWSAAKLNQVPYVLTEDAPHRRRIGAVTYLDPFDRSFVLPS